MARVAAKVLGELNELTDGKRNRIKLPKLARQFPPPNIEFLLALRRSFVYYYYYKEDMGRVPVPDEAPPPEVSMDDSEGAGMTTMMCARWRSWATPRPSTGFCASASPSCRTRTRP